MFSTGTVTFSQCHFDAWDTHQTPNMTKFHNGTAAIRQFGGTLQVAQSEFRQGFGSDWDPEHPVKSLKPNHFWLGPQAKKTIITENIIKGVLSVENEGHGKVIVANNADDSPNL